MDSLILLSLLSVLQVSADVPSSLSVSLQCSTLSLLLPGRVAYPADIVYIKSIESYFWTQDRLTPACVVTPKNTLDISIAVKTLATIHVVQKTSRFAIRSGGHSTVSGAANDDYGVTIDLRALNTVKVRDKNVVSVGAGSIWSDIYSQLEPLNLTVNGGRVAGIGVGGFLTGGGISFFSPMRGWAADSVVGMEVVLADGSIVYTNDQLLPDLFAALKGGSNNFGIVTRFDLAAFSIGQFLGGYIIYPSTNVSQQLSAFNTFMDPKNFDPRATAIQAYTYQGSLNNTIISNGLEYSVPVLDPPVFAGFKAIQPQLGSTMRLSKVTDFVVESAAFQPVNSRGIYVTSSFYPNVALLNKVHSLWDHTIAKLRSVSNLQYSLIFQRLPKTLPEAKNSLGLNSTAQDVVLCLLTVAWTNELDDALIRNTTKSLIDEIEIATKTTGAFHEFKYLNYASDFQDPIASYGAVNKRKLQAVSKKYDPLGLFQTGVPGGFKLF
ncbi:hypothetical protein B0O99DRAFT_656947 [Bisporella sp. PMI_857]|nr:hypothetical protein B0O99DRAFT_656947 [Bisporella sp. PMI_857]